MNSWLSISFLHRDPNFSLFKTIKNRLRCFNFYFLQAYQPYLHHTYIVQCSTQELNPLLSKEIKIIQDLSAYDGYSPALLVSIKNNPIDFWGGEAGLNLFHEQQQEHSKLVLHVLESKSEDRSSWNIKEAIHLQLIHAATSHMEKVVRLQFMERFSRYYFQAGFGNRQQYDVLVKEYEQHFQSQKNALLHNARIILDIIQEDEPDLDFIYTGYILYMKDYSRMIHSFIQEVHAKAEYNPMQIAYHHYDGMTHFSNNRLQIDLRDEAMVVYFVKRILEELNFENPLPLNSN